MSGRSMERRDLVALLGFARHGDTLAVVRPDRLMPSPVASSKRPSSASNWSAVKDRTKAWAACLRARVRPAMLAPFDGRDRQPHDARVPQTGDDAAGDADALVCGPRCSRSRLDHQGKIAPNRPSHPEPGRQLARMIGHHLIAGRAIGHHHRGQPKLGCDESDQFAWHLLSIEAPLRKRRPRMPQQCKLKRNPKQGPLCPAPADDVDIVRLKRLEPRQLVAVAGGADQLLALGVCHKFVFALRHRGSPPTKCEPALWTRARQETSSVDGLGGLALGRWTRPWNGLL